MIRKFFSFTINTLYLISIIFIVVMVTITALINKINFSLQSKSAFISGNVVKQDIPILATGSATVRNFFVLDGEHVKSGDKLFSLSQTGTASNSIEQTVPAPANGIVKFAKLKPGDSVQNDWIIVDLYTDDNPRLLVYLTQDQYSAIRNLSDMQAYSKRLDQSFTVVPKMFQADTVTNGDAQEKVGVYFDFKDNTYAASLLQNETLQVILPQPKQITINDIFKRISYLSQ